MFLAEIMLRESTASAAVSSTSGLFLIRPGRVKTARVTKTSVTFCPFTNRAIYTTHQLPAPGRPSSGARCPSRG